MKKINEASQLRMRLAQVKDENLKLMRTNFKLRVALKKLYEFVFDEHRASDPNFVHGDERDYKVNFPANQKVMDEARTLLSPMNQRRMQEWRDGQPTCAGSNEGCEEELTVGMIVFENEMGLLYCSLKCLRGDKRFKV